MDDSEARWRRLLLIPDDDAGMIHVKAFASSLEAPAVTRDVRVPEHWSIKVTESTDADPERLLEVVRWTMPFGKYKGVVLIDLPQPYLVWFSQRGFPKGKLGETMALALEIKLNGLEDLVRPLREGAYR
jgi:uncharacterized protein (DUF3820 family)